MGGTILACVLVLAAGGLILGTVGTREAQKKQKKEEKSPESGAGASAEESKKSAAQAEPKRSDSMDDYVRRYAEREAARKAREKEILDRWGFAEGGIEEARQEANRKNLEGAVYRCDPAAPFGSVDNPEVVGIPECSNDLRFSMEREHWILTDGLGNGWLR